TGPRIRLDAAESKTSAHEPDEFRRHQPVVVAPWKIPTRANTETSLWLALHQPQPKWNRSTLHCQHSQAEGAGVPISPGSFPVRESVRCADAARRAWNPRNHRTVARTASHSVETRKPVA